MRRLIPILVIAIICFANATAQDSTAVDQTPPEGQALLGYKVGIHKHLALFGYVNPQNPLASVVNTVIYIENGRVVERFEYGPPMTINGERVTHAELRQWYRERVAEIDAELYWERQRAEIRDKVYGPNSGR